MAHDSIKTGLKIDFICFEALKNKTRTNLSFGPCVFIV